MIAKFFKVLKREYNLNGLLGLTRVWRKIVNKIYNVLFLKRYHISADYSSWINGLKYMEIGHLSVGRWCRIEMITKYGEQKFQPNLKIGNGVVLNDKVHIGCAKYIEIGDNCLFASGIYVSDHLHGWYRSGGGANKAM